MERNRRGRREADGSGADPVPGDNRLRLESRQQARIIRQYFQRERPLRYEAVTVISEGAWGFTLKMKTVVPPGPSASLAGSRTFVIKAAPPEVRHAEDNLETEFGFLQRLRRCMHIVNLIPPEKVRIQSSSVILMEWIPNGLLRDLLGRIADRGQPLPNRMLWRLFLCLCRMLIGMAWPDSTTAQGLEVIPASNTISGQSRIVHGDLNHGNVMIGNIESTEHTLVPILKLIDFGAASEMPETQDANDAIRTNMLYIGRIMLFLVGGIHRSTPSDMKIHVGDQTNEKTIRSFAKDLDEVNPLRLQPLRSENDRRTVADEHRRRMNNLDPNLRDLLVQCLASNKDNRPALPDLVREVENNIRTGTEQYYRQQNFPYAQNESDAALRRISRELFLDASTS
ncbi:hypothetical protein GGR54DRAFT_587337 [Hypoxylon sp. NC1633]|nr:hypothetical protein GGR54DRAFT_587337 [Hypoxylon sp. NC1633]